jgi:hypothetical protein
VCLVYLIEHERSTVSSSSSSGATQAGNGLPQQQGRQSTFEKALDFLRLTNVATLAWLWSRKWRYFLVAALFLGGELLLLHWHDLAQELDSGADAAQLSAFLWDAVANLGGARWVLALSALLALIILPLCAWWVYRHEYPGSHEEALASYVARRVSHLRASDYVPKHAYKIDTSHPTTRLVRAALRTAKRSSLSRARVSYIAPLPIGVCIFGRPLHDKTGLAWIAMRTIFPGWSLVKWPHRFEHRADIEAQCGSRVVLWLDDLHEYANHVEAAQLDALIDRFAERGIQVVVVATCRWHEDEREARARLGYLFDHLLPIRLTEAPGDHSADPVVSQPTVDAPLHQSIRTNREIELRLRDDLSKKTADYAALQAGNSAELAAATILRAMGFLRRAGVRVYPRPRVRSVANHLGLAADDEVWLQGLRILQDRGYIRPLPDLRGSKVRTFFVKRWRWLRRKGPRPLGDLEPVTMWYLDRVVADASPTPGEPDPTLATVWQSLRNSGDTEALTLLGDAYLNPRNLHLRQNGAQAFECYNAALNALGAQRSHGHAIRRAAARLGLGHAHMATAGTLGEGPRKLELDAALAAFITAANEAEPLLLRAEAFQSRGNAHVALADYAESERQPPTVITPLLTSAEIAFKEALARFTRAHSPFQWATTQYDLANALKRRARILSMKPASANITSTSAPPSPDDEGPKLFVEAEQAYRRAANVYTRANAPTDWAKIQRDRADAQINWITVLSTTSLDAERTKQRNRRLEEAVDALRAVVSTFRQFNLLDDATSANILLGEALNLEAQSMDDSQAKQMKFAEAYEVMAATLVVNRREQRPLDWACAKVKLADIALRQAQLAKAGYTEATFKMDARFYAGRAGGCLTDAYQIYKGPRKPPFDDPALSGELDARMLDVRARVVALRAFNIEVTFE